MTGRKVLFRKPEGKGVVAVWLKSSDASGCIIGFIDENGAFWPDIRGGVIGLTPPEQEMIAKRGSEVATMMAEVTKDV